MRIISGTLGGRSLHVPRHAAFRPTSDRVKESLFNILAHRMDFAGAAVCDLFAGSGNLGLEALSRGAHHATFVERDRSSLAVLAANIEALGQKSTTSVIPMPVESFIRQRGGSFDLVFADPPYAYEAGETLVASAQGLLLPGGWFVYEHGGGAAYPLPSELSLVTEREFGTTVLSLYRRDASDSSDDCIQQVNP